MFLYSRPPAGNQRWTTGNRVENIIFLLTIFSWNDTMAKNQSKSSGFRNFQFQYESAQNIRVPVFDDAEELGEEIFCFDNHIRLVEPSRSTQCYDCVSKMSIVSICITSYS